MNYVTMQITFLTRKFRNAERNLHCDVVHIITVSISGLTLDCNGVFAIKAYSVPLALRLNFMNVDDPAETSRKSDKSAQFSIT